MKLGKTFIRIAVSLVLLAALLYWIGPASLLESMQQFHPGFYALAVALTLVHFFMQAYILRTLLRSKAIQAKTRQIFRLMMISYLFGLFLPGGIGPDLVLCYNLVRSAEKKEDVLSAVIFIRISVLFIMVLVAFACSFAPLVSGIRIQPVTGLILLGFLCYYFLMANQSSLALARKLLNFLDRHHLTRILYKTYFALSDYGRDKRLVLTIAPWFLLSSFLKIVVDYIIAISLGLDISLVYFFVFIPLVNLAAVIPLTFAGIGIREGSFIGLFTLVGVEKADAFSISILSFTLNFWIALVGLIFYAVWGSSLVTKTHDAATPDNGR